jgi:dienelactone hydrolase
MDDSVLRRIVYDDPAVYAKSDPMHFVKAVKTPTLILVGDRDGEVPMEQSVEWWHALTNLHVPTKLVVYPNEGHMFMKPADCARLLRCAPSTGSTNGSRKRPRHPRVSRRHVRHFSAPQRCQTVLDRKVERS